MLSLGTVVYLIAKAVPRINDEEFKKNPSVLPSHGFMSFLERVDDRLKIISEKFLRWLRIWILKLDNWITGHLKKFKKETAKETGFDMENTSNSVKNDVSGEADLDTKI